MPALRGAHFESVIGVRQRAPGFGVVPNPGVRIRGELRSAADSQLTDADAVDANLDVGARAQAPYEAGVGAVQSNFEHVLAINRKEMARRDPAARPERKLLSEPLVLPQPRGLVRVVLQRRVALEPAEWSFAETSRASFAAAASSGPEARAASKGVGIVVDRKLLVGGQHGLGVDFHSRRSRTALAYQCGEPMELAVRPGVTWRRRHGRARSGMWHAVVLACRAVARTAAASNGFGAHDNLFPRVRRVEVIGIQVVEREGAVFRPGFGRQLGRGTASSWSRRVGVPSPCEGPAWVTVADRVAETVATARSIASHQRIAFLPCSHKRTPAGIVLRWHG